MMPEIAQNQPIPLTQIVEKREAVPADPNAPVACPLCTTYYGDITKHAPIPKRAKELVVELLKDFVASSGRTVDEDGTIGKRMSMEMFAHLNGYSRRQLYNWIDEDPLWDAKVLQRIPVVYGNPKRVARVISGLFAEASAGDNKSVETYLRNFWKDYKSPQTKLEHEVGNNLADLIKNAQRRRQRDQLPDRQVIDADVAS